jgi:hypothetical protein
MVRTDALIAFTFDALLKRLQSLVSGDFSETA